MPVNKTKTIEIKSNVNYQPTNGFRQNFAEGCAGWIKKYFNAIQIVVAALGIIVLLFLFVAFFSVVDGPSMEKNFFTGELTIYEKITTSWGKLHRGDVVVFDGGQGKDFIKRVIGLPGEKVKIQNGKVYINNIALNEPYLSTENKNVKAGSYFQEGKEITIPANQYACFGDNRAVSLDSRNIGTIDISRLKGKVWLVFWPVEKFHFIDSVTYPELGNS